MNTEDTEISDKAAPGMTAKQLAAHIKEQKDFTWEETAEFLLRLSMADLHVQQHFKVNGDEQKIPRPLQLIIACAKELGWGIALEKPEEGTDVNPDLNGFHIGNDEWLKKNLPKKEKSDEVN